LTENAGKTNVKLTDQVSKHGIDGHKIDEHEIKGQDIYRLKMDYITMPCATLFETTAKHKSQQQNELYNMHMYRC